MKITALPNETSTPVSSELPNRTVTSPAKIATAPDAVLNPALNRETKTGTSVGSATVIPASANEPSLFEQRLEAGKQLLDQKKAVASIQLYYNEEINPTRIEGFLKRADALGKLSEIYLLPAKLGGKNGIRVLYGAYPSVEAAHKAVKYLPARYQAAFATSTYIF